jgi:hypothetical protein
MTTFPYKRVPGRKGSGQIQATAYTVPKGTMPVLELEVVEDPNDKRKGWTTDEISRDVNLRGFCGPVLSVREVSEQERFYVDALRMRTSHRAENRRRKRLLHNGKSTAWNPVE